MNTNYWDEKRDFHKKLGIKSLWFISERTENIDYLDREINLSFTNRMILNDLNNKIIFLDVETEEVTIVSKIVIKDIDTDEIIYDKLFKKTYPLSDIKILPDGTIECDFKKKFKEDKSKFEEKYIEEKRKKEEAEKESEIVEKRRQDELEKFKLDEEERIRQLKKQQEEKEEEKEDAWSEIGYNTKNYNKDSHYNKAAKKNYSNYKKKDETYYRNKINQIMNGDSYARNTLVKNLMYGGSDDFSFTRKIFQERIDSGDNKAKNIMNQIIRQAHLD